MWSEKQNGGVGDTDVAYEYLTSRSEKMAWCLYIQSLHCFERARCLQDAVSVLTLYTIGHAIYYRSH